MTSLQTRKCGEILDKKIIYRQHMTTESYLVSFSASAFGVGGHIDGRHLHIRRIGTSITKCYEEV